MKHQKPLEGNDLRRLENLGSRAEAMWAEFNQRGFGLPKLVDRDFIELCATEAELVALQTYRREVFRERTSLQYSFGWTPEFRARLPSNIRSQFLDKAISEARRRASAPDDDLLSNLDPILSRYQQIPHQNLRKWQSMVASYTEAIRNDANSLLPNDKADWGGQITTTEAKRLLQREFESCDFVLADAKRLLIKGPVFVRAVHGSKDLQQFFALRDANTLRKGYWHCAIGFCRAGDVFDTPIDSKVLMSGWPHVWFPGSIWYFQHDNSDKLPLLSIRAALAMLHILGSNI